MTKLFFSHYNSQINYMKWELEVLSKNKFALKGKDKTKILEHPAKFILLLKYINLF